MNISSSSYRLVAGLLAIVFGSAGVGVCRGAPPRLKVSPDHRFLVTEKGQPFFYLGDTAWELFHRLNEEESRKYLTNRAEKGFTVIQAVVLAELDGLRTPNANGDIPLKENDPTRPVEAYFQHVDRVVDQAAELGLYIGMLPTWGDKWISNQGGDGPVIFNVKNARAYGEFLGKRYRNSPIIWILGGDRSLKKDEHLAIIRAMAEGLQAGDGGNHLMTFHPRGGENSANLFHQDKWLDFNMVQSGHGQLNTPNYKFALNNRALTPVKPTLDGEPRYEDHPVNWRPDQGWFDEWDVRQAAYWSMLAGACGHTYGDHNIWQMWQPGRRPISSARTAWQTALDHPGAFQMGHLRRLFESRPWQLLEPDQELIVGDAGSGAYHVRAARASDGSFAFVYTPMGKPVTIDLAHLTEHALTAHWFDPRLGKASSISTISRAEQQTFTPPSQGRGNDWILVLDEQSRQFSAPGSSPLLK